MSLLPPSTAGLYGKSRTEMSRDRFPLCHSAATNRLENSTLASFLPIDCFVRRQDAGHERRATGDAFMGKGNNSQKNDKKSMKPKQDKTKPAAKK
jgi:hypothetical protein